MDCRMIFFSFNDTLNARQNGLAGIHWGVEWRAGELLLVPFIYEEGGRECCAMKLECVRNDFMSTPANERSLGW